MIRLAHSRRSFLSAGATLAGVALLPATRAQAAASATATTRDGAIALAFDPTGQLLYKASAGALTRSSDSGRHWSRVDLPPASASRSLAGLAVAAGARPALYVAGTGFGVLRSEDSGRRWRLMDAGPRGGVVRSIHSNSKARAAAIAALVAMPAGTLYAAAADGNLFSRRGGAAAGWESIDA